jgi:hypothetical protein
MADDYSGQDEGFPSFFDDHDPPAAQQQQRKALPPKPQRSAVGRLRPTESFEPKVLDALNTFDKRERSNASPPTRRRHFASRIARSSEKIASSVAAPPQTVDDSLMRDQVGRMTSHYRRFSEYGGSERVFPPAEGRKREREEDEADALQTQNDYDDNDEVELDEDGNPIHEELASYRGTGGDEDDQMASRMLITPVISTRIPDQAATRHPQTFSEYTGASAGSNQFKRVLRHVQGPEQGVAMEVRDVEDIYPAVTATLAAPLRNQEIQRIAVERGLRIPDLPKVSKAEIQDGLCAPNAELGERECVNGTTCAGFRMCLDVKKEHPEKYAHARPFACKEFYFGKYGQEMRQAIAMGTPPNELRQGDPIMCVLCHLELVTRGYKQYDLLLRTDPPHILHPFQVSVGVPGGYPADKCLMGDEVFKAKLPQPFYFFLDD